MKTKYFVNFEEASKQIAQQLFRVEESFIALPDTPGPGIDPDEEELRKRSYRQRPRRDLDPAADHCRSLH